jgi:hypothetical protein
MDFSLLLSFKNMGSLGDGLSVGWPPCEAALNPHGLAWRKGLKDIMSIQEFASCHFGRTEDGRTLHPRVPQSHLSPWLVLEICPSQKGRIAFILLPYVR